MNAFEARKYLMDNAKSVMDEADDRMSHNVDPITGERWEGDSRLFYLKYKTVLGFADKSNDPIDKVPVEKEGKRLTNTDRIQIIIDKMLAGEIDANSAELTIKPLIGYMTFVEKRESYKTINQANYLANDLRMGELRDMSDEDLKREMKETLVRLAEEDKAEEDSY